ncbi:MAG: methyltransferase domain-containing protein [Neisseriaceae bacterium]|nr:MAG: methyltransferase domain-containing protein [Neisseriaceae bacterium]
MQNQSIIDTLKYLLKYFEDLEKHSKPVAVVEEIALEVTPEIEVEETQVVENKEQQTSEVKETQVVENKEQQTSEVKENFVINKDLFPKETHLLLDVLSSPMWPEAVPEFLICEDQEEDRKDRAEGILDFVYQNLNIDISRKKFLDFGCEAGHIALEAAKKAQNSVGYDIKKFGNYVWEEVDQNCLLTTDFEKVKENGHYHFIMLYDVLDHVSDPVEVLKQVKSVCAPHSVVFLRFHSWMSRHGAHLYKKFNKAWIQIIFSEEELKLMGLIPETVQRYTRPIATQKGFIEEAGFTVIQESFETSIVEPFFKESLLRDRFFSNFGTTFPEFQMSQSFNDYLIKIK